MYNGASDGGSGLPRWGPEEDPAGVIDAVGLESPEFHQKWHRPRIRSANGFHACQRCFRREKKVLGFFMVILNLIHQDCKSFMNESGEQPEKHNASETD